jgi:hypothetical protein
MHETPDHSNTPTSIEDTGRSPDQPEQRRAGLLSQSDPEPERSTGRPPIWLILIIALLVTGFVVLHLTGVFGPGSH